MSFDSLLRHRCTVRSTVPVLDGNGDPTYDDLGQPITTTTDADPVPCRIEPLTATEAPQLVQAGPVVADHVIFMRRATLTTGDVIIAGDGRQFEVDSADDAGGAGHHLEVKARRISSPDAITP